MNFFQMRSVWVPDLAKAIGAAMKRIEVCGGVASGKTTLATLLATEGKGTLVLEDFRRNPFWELFYKNPARFVYEKNICFLAQHCGAIKDLGPKGGSDLVFCDYAVVQDLAYAAMSKNPEHSAVMKQIYAHLGAEIEPPALVIHLKCAESILLERIRIRGRPQERTITLDYLYSLNRALEDALVSSNVTVRELRSDQIDFANDARQRALIASELLAAC
jgi:deoxyadenosine/deoxycytidine kinase